MHERYRSEEAYLEKLVSRPIRVFLVNGVCLRGRLEGASEFAIFLTDESTISATPQLVFKNSVTSISLEDERRSDRRGDTKMTPGALLPPKEALRGLLGQPSGE